MIVNIKNILFRKKPPMSGAYYSVNTISITVTGIAIAREKNFCGRTIREGISVTDHREIIFEIQFGNGFQRVDSDRIRLIVTDSDTDQFFIVMPHIEEDNGPGSVFNPKCCDFISK